MKRKMTAMCLAAVLLSAGTVNLTAWAEGWAEVEGNWVYYDSNGNKVYNDWKRERMGSGVIWTETGPWRSTPGWTENTM